jgi:serine/threonine protein kinase
MGEVYRARDTRLERTIAIKVLPPSLASDPQFRVRFDREARTISQLDHPHICALHDVGEQDGVAFLVMQYQEGETLAARLARRPSSRGRHRGADARRLGIRRGERYARAIDVRSRQLLAPVDA